MQWWLAGVVITFAACGTSKGRAPADARLADGEGGADADSRDGGADADSRDGGDLEGDPGSPGDGGDATWRSSLAVCWTDASCPRVMAVGHGGLWDLSSVPYDSNAALIAAHAAGMDGVKIDVRVTADDVPVIAHSSPIEYFESLDCYNRRIEEMTAAEVTDCHRLPSTTETFQRLDDVLSYLRGKMVAQLCVKRADDFARTIVEIQAQGAEDFAFIELSTSELQTLIPTLPGAEDVYYLVNVASNLAEVDTLLDVIHNPRAFMFEFDPTVELGDLVTTRLHPAGVRSFTYESSQLASAAALEGLFNAGFDVVSANTGANAVEARIRINQGRGVLPP